MADPHYLELSGDAYTRGRTHGGELRCEVTACVDFYRAILGLGEAELRQAGTGRGGNILLAAASAEAVNFEFAGDYVDERQLEENFCHTNHCLFRQIPAGELEANSMARLQRAGELLPGRASPDLADLQDILSDQQDPDFPICAPYHPLFGLELGTICTVAMDLPRRQLHLRTGSDPSADFTVYSL